MDECVDNGARPAGEIEIKPRVDGRPLASLMVWELPDRPGIALHLTYHTPGEPPEEFSDVFHELPGCTLRGVANWIVALAQYAHETGAHEAPPLRLRGDNGYAAMIRTARERWGDDG